MMLLLQLLLLLFVILLCCSLICHSTYWQRRGVAGPGGWPLVGNMLHFALGWRSYGEVYARLYNKHSMLSYVGIYRLFNAPALLVRDQQLLHQLLIGSNFVHCADNALCLDVNRDPLAIHNPFVACGDLWRQQRAALVPLFTPHRLRQTQPHIAAACLQLRQFVAQRLSRVGFEAKELATRYTLQVIASAVFGLDAQCLNVEENKSNNNNNNEWLTLLAPLFQPSGWSLAETIALLHSPRLGWLLRHRYVPVKVHYWLHRLVAARIEGNTLLNWLRDKQDTNIEGHAATLLLEGFETSAMLLAFTLYELALNPIIQRRLQAELDEVAQRNDGQLLSHEALNALPYAEATLYESLRLHPAMQALFKRCTKSFTMPAQREADDPNSPRLRVPKDMVLIVPVQAIHLDETLFPMPLQFQPERFNEQTQLGCRFLGFGAGPRMCPGIRLGLAQTKAALVTLLHDYNVRLADERQPAVEKSTNTFLTATKRGIWLSLHPR